MAKVIASSLRRGSVIEFQDKLYTILKAENIHPGKGTPITQVDMRRLTDGIKVSKRFCTTEMVERAIVEERPHTYLYAEGDQYTFMDVDTFDQVQVSGEVLGEQKAYLQENMEVRLSLHEGKVLSLVLPQRVILEVAETEPSMRGQTASSSYKPAVLSNGVRTMVPPHIEPGTRVFVMTEDGSYSEKAKG